MLACVERKIIPLWAVHHSLQTLSLWKIVLGVPKIVCSPQTLDLKGHDSDEATPSLNKLVTRANTVLSLEKVWGPELSTFKRQPSHTRSLRRQEGKGSIVCCNPATREKGLLAFSYGDVKSCQVCQQTRRQLKLTFLWYIGFQKILTRVRKGTLIAINKYNCLRQDWYFICLSIISKFAKNFEEVSERYFNHCTISQFSKLFYAHRCVGSRPVKTYIYYFINFFWKTKRGVITNRFIPFSLLVPLEWAGDWN